MILSDEPIKVSEFALACSLVSVGFKLCSLDRHDQSGRVLFCFKYEKRADQIIEKYWDGSLMVNAVVFYQNLRLLKSRLRNENL
jgi:hypothetical protein